MKRIKWFILAALVGWPGGSHVGIAAGPTQQSAPRVRDDPAADGWRTEVLGAAAEQNLKEVVSRLVAPAPIASSLTSQLVSEDFRSTSLRPVELVEVYRDGSLTVLRPEAMDQEWRHARREGLAEALENLRRPWIGGNGLHAQIKVYRVQPSPQGFVAEVLFHASARIEGGGVEQNAAWEARFVGSGETLRLARLRLLRYEEVVFDGESKLFSDCTLSVFRNEAVFAEQLRHGIPHWVQRTQAVLGTDYFGHHGLALGDVNGDGLEDLYLAQPAGLPNRLLLQNPDGTVRDAAAGAGVDWLDRTRGALLIDLDNDGDLDLAAALQDSLMVMSNDGAGRFRERARLPAAANAYTLSAADFDGDADLDLYACHYFPSEQDERRFPQPVPHHDANNGGRNVLLRNDGGWKFVDATREAGLDVNNRRWSFAASWEDYDRDGDADLYVANDFGRNNLYRNEGGTFRDATDEAGMKDSGFGMSTSWGDFNRDGWMDLYVGNMFSSAGNRIVPQEQFKPGVETALRQSYSRLVGGNALYRNQGGETFRDVATALGANLGWWAWGSVFADLNNDGWEDLVVSNGYLSGSITKDL